MRKKLIPPAGKRERQSWDQDRHWQRTWHERIRQDGIIPETIQHWRPMILQAYRKGGIAAAEKFHAERVADFRQWAKEGHLTAEEAKGAIENLDSFLRQLRQKHKL